MPDDFNRRLEEVEETVAEHDRFIRRAMRVIILASGVLIGLGVLNIQTVWSFISHAGP